ncbi:MAG: serine/threonine protein kinase [Planctomycetaceae bacterium]|jgi:serine/threonine protein kinase|nr:serine/threonine protein kinase [Planctomycetaceae bacterium]
MQPEQLGPFRIGRVLGRGGMGAVYEGVHEQTGESAAVKVLLSTLQEDDELRLRFEAEIDTLKRLRHPNIVRLFGFGEEQGMLYYVMEMVDGPSLQQEMKRQRLFQWHEVAKIGLEMCSAFKHAHDRGITHRDIKPANILLERQGSLKLSDFGIAHFFGGQRLTEAHSVVGTLEYMSPEQALANPVNARSDLYSLGAVLYALLVGRPPFIAKSLPEILRKHQKNIIESIRSSRLDVPDELEIIIFDLLKITPEERPQHAYLVTKRFQSLLQALVGPPERILVKPMDTDSSLAFPMEPVRIPYKGDQEQEKKIEQARGIIIENGIIDLGGIINPNQTNFNNALDSSKKSLTNNAAAAPTMASEISEQEEIENLPPEIPPTPNKTSLVNSFGSPGQILKERKTQTLELATPLDLTPEPSVTQAFTVSSSTNQSPNSTIDSNQLRVPNSPQQLPDAAPNIVNIPNNQNTPTKTPTKKSVETVSPDTFPQQVPIQHGEVVLDNVYAIRRTKDEPLPDVNVFDALQQQNRPLDHEPEEQPTLEIDLSHVGHSQITSDLTHNKPTVEGLTAGHAPGFYALSKPASANPIPRGNSDIPQNRTAKPSEKNKTVEPYGVQHHEVTVVGSKDRSSSTTEHASASSHFTAVKDEEFDTFGDSATEHRPIISLQTVFASCCLVLIGITVYYLLQPVSADTLYERIKRTINDNSTNDELSSSALRRAEDDINQFLLEYSQHPMAEQVRFYQTELDLAKQEQLLKRRQRIANSEMPSPVEQIYMEATALIKTDPENAIAKLQAIVNVFQPNNPEKRFEKPETPSDKDNTTELEIPKITRRQRPNPTELCVELAIRRLEKLEKEIKISHSDQFKIIRKRLDDAKTLEQQFPEQAKNIRLGIIELYQHHRWAKTLVEEAQQELKK